MISTTVHPAAAIPGVDRAPRVWGMGARALHDAFWKSQGVQVIRRGKQDRLEPGADLFLLLDPDQLVLFDLAALADRLFWRSASVTRVRLAKPDDTYAERIVFNEGGQIERISRRYRAPGQRAARVLVTGRRRIARLWGTFDDRTSAWSAVRRTVPASDMDPVRCEGRAYREGEPGDEHKLIAHLVRLWPDPSVAIEGIERCGDDVWRLADDRFEEDAVVVGPAWLGRGSARDADACLIGPTWRADAEPMSKACRTRSISEISPAESRPRPRRWTQPAIYPFAKRAFDIVFSLVALAVSLPIIAYVAYRIRREDGGPIFYAHERQGRGGRTFRCWKFRTMRHDADKMKVDFEEQNECDGPQFFISHDPRVTKIGRRLRRLQLDELPQFWNVLRGQMSIVGPRPSPDAENQYCPAWREMRLSVRPGITGIWQIQRTRAPLEDFQEWIRYDIEYVERAGFWLDIRIVCKTIWVLALRKRA